MSELDARYERGQETRRMFGGGQITGGSSPGAWDIAPDLERILGEGLFGSIWPREALTPVQREMITLSSLIVLNREVQLRRHLGNALNVGLTPEQIVELIIHDTWYSGAPGGIQALTICKQVFEERGIDFTPARIHDANEDPDSLFQRGDEYRRNYMGGGGNRPAPPTQAEAELGRITGEYYWGATWTRPGLDLPSRCLCTMTCLAALRLRTTHPDMDRPYRTGKPVMYCGIAVSAILVLLMVVPGSPGQLRPLEFAIIGAWMCLGVAGYCLRRFLRDMDAEQQDYLILGEETGSPGVTHD